MSTEQDDTSVYTVAVVSPLEHAEKLSKMLNNHILLKREDTQSVHSFKLRGAFNKMSKLTKTEKEHGVLCASAGNHAQGVALAAQTLNISACIVMPITTPEIKVQAVKEMGAEVILHGDNYSEAAEHAALLTKSSGRIFIPPFDDEDVITGQGTIGAEIINQCKDVDYIFVPVGGGGLIVGVAKAIKKVNRKIKVIGVEPTDSAAMTKSLQANRRITLSHVGIFADGVAVKQVGKLNFEYAKKHVDEMITVSNDQICAAIKYIYYENRTVVEPAGALSVAGAHKWLTENNVSDAKVVCIVSGANLSFEKLQFIAERTMLGSGKEVLYSIKLSEESGALEKLCSEVIRDVSITEFSYRKNNTKQANIFIGITFSNPETLIAFQNRLAQSNYEFVVLTDNELAKEHIRHMVGGISTDTTKEGIYSLELPERSGALIDLLKHIGSNHNISLFHYRGLGGDVGRVLLGLENSSQQTMKDLSPYNPKEVTDDIASKLFLQQTSTH